MKGLKKAAILTLNGDFNYGNRLQNYAVKKFFEKNGITAVTLVKNSKSKKQKVKVFIKETLCKVAPDFIKKSRPQIYRNHNFIMFTNNNIPTKIYNCGLACFANEFDFFVVGSDQVWNPCFLGYEEIFSEMFLQGIPNEKKRCIAPSFGVNKIPDEWTDRFAKALKEFPKLCAREKAGTDIIENLTGRKEPVMIDPTMLIDGDGWLEIAKKVDGLPKNYVIDYFLGATPCDNENYKSAENESVKRVRMFDSVYPEVFVAGPSEFIYLIANAESVCTDSFHACVFSILFNKPFRVFRRKDAESDMFSRIDTLLSLFDVNSDNYSNGETIFITNEKRNDVLMTKRREVFKYFFE